MFDTRRNRPTKAIIITILLAVLVLTACSGPRGWPGAALENGVLYVGTMDGRLLVLNPESGARKWELKPEPKESEQVSGFLSCGAGAGSLKAGMFYGSPVVANDSVFIGSYTGVVYAIDAVRGVTTWDYDVESSIAGGVAVAEGTLFVGSAKGKLIALDAGNGTLEWEFPAENDVWSTPVVADGIVYFGSIDHNLYALNAADGTEKWMFPTNGSIASTPVVVDGVVYVGSFDSKFYAVYADSGNLKWVFDEAGNWYWSQAVYENGVIYAGSLDNKVYAINAGNGTSAWSEPFDTGSPVKASPVVVKNVLVVVSEQGMVYGLDLQNGEKKWQFDEIEAKVLSPIGADGEKIYINAQDNRLYALNADNGRQAWSVSLAK